MTRSIKDLSFIPRMPVHPSSSDWRNEVIYHLLIDRFDNDQETSLADLKYASKEPLDPAHGKVFKGGKIAGITRRLDYIKNLGCTAIWISPPFKNRQHSNESYHGYGIQNFLEVDPRFGTLEDLKTLVREAHRLQMYVIVDVVINHTGDNWGYVNDSPQEFKNGKRFEFGGWRGADGKLLAAEATLDVDDAVWPREFQSVDCYHRRCAIQNWSGDGTKELLEGDLGGMKDLDHSCSDTLNAFIACYKWWIAEIDCDGFRMDAIKHCEPHAVSRFANAIREYALSIGKANFFLFAEVIAEDDVLVKYVGLNTPALEEPDQEYPRLCACLDFPLYNQLEEVVKGRKSSRELKARYEKFQHYFRDYGAAGTYFVTFLDNHDQIGRSFFRFMYGEDDPRLAVLGVGYLLMSMGIPCIYYGTEQGLNGGGEEGDFWLRETMFGSDFGGFGTTVGNLFNEDSPIYQSIAKLSQIRQQEATLRYGRQYFVEVFQDVGILDLHCELPEVFAFTRVLDTTCIIVVFNVSPQTQKCFVDVDETFFSEGHRLQTLMGKSEAIARTLQPGKVCIQLQLPPRSISVFKN